VKQFLSAIVVALLVSQTAVTMAFAEDFYLHTFERTQLTDVYYSEGANFGDFNRDDVMDVVYGPFWFQGPDYKKET